MLEFPGALREHFSNRFNLETTREESSRDAPEGSGAISALFSLEKLIRKLDTETPESESSPKLSREHVPSHFLIRADRILPSDVIDICCWGGGVFFLKFLLFW